MKYLIKISRLISGCLGGILIFSLLNRYLYNSYAGISHGVVLWLPMYFLYGAIILCAATRLKWMTSFPVLEINGIVMVLLMCIGLWPPYMMMPLLAIVVIGLDLMVLALTNLIMFGVLSLITACKRSVLKNQQET